ncbi:hypothetical protein B0H14DRAFT_781600 [Mycena olivaceomarginata]|nr:hypothetical protein B0H14DRAFT_781600 [Mycena olivaceomarginata]
MPTNRAASVPSFCVLSHSLSPTFTRPAPLSLCSCSPRPNGCGACADLVGGAVTIPITSRLVRMRIRIWTRKQRLRPRERALMRTARTGCERRQRQRWGRQCCGPRTRESTGQLGNGMSKGMMEKLRARRTRASVGREVRHSPFVLRPSMLACPCALNPPAIAHFPMLANPSGPHTIVTRPALSLCIFPPVYSELMDADLEVEAPRRRRGRKTRVRYVDNWGARRTETERERDTGPSSRSEGVRMAWVRLVSSRPFLPIQCATTNTKPPSVHL